MALASTYYELALAAVGDLASDRIVEEAMLQAIDNEPFEQVDCLADLAAIGALERRFGLQLALCSAPLCPVAAKATSRSFIPSSLGKSAYNWRANRATSSLDRPWWSAAKRRVPPGDA